MYKTEMRILMVAATGIFSLLPLSFIPSSLFLGEVETEVTDKGIVTFHREPLFNDIVLTHNQEVVTIDGRTCTAGISRSSYEKTESNTIIYQLAPILMPCVEEGAKHRVTRQFMFFRPTTTETIIVKEDL